MISFQIWPTQPSRTSQNNDKVSRRAKGQRPLQVDKCYTCIKFPTPVGRVVWVTHVRVNLSVLMELHFQSVIWCYCYVVLVDGRISWCSKHKWKGWILFSWWLRYIKIAISNNSLQTYVHICYRLLFTWNDSLLVKFHTTVKQHMLS